MSTLDYLPMSQYVGLCTATLTNLAIVGFPWNFLNTKFDPVLMSLLTNDVREILLWFSVFMRSPGFRAGKILLNQHGSQI